jgi:hypothetical protein
MDTIAFNQSLVLAGVGMAVLFVFMGLMILIIHYFQIIAGKFSGK